MDWFFMSIIGGFLIIILIYLAKSTIKQLFLGLSIAIVFAIFFKIFLYTFCKTNYYFFITKPLGLKNLEKIPDIYLNFFILFLNFAIVILATKLNWNIQTNGNKLKNLIFIILISIFNIILTLAIIITVFFIDVTSVFKLFEKNIVFAIFNLLLIILIGSISLLIIFFYKKEKNLDNQNINGT